MGLVFGKMVKVVTQEAQEKDSNNDFYTYNNGNWELVTFYRMRRKKNIPERFPIAFDYTQGI